MECFTTLAPEECFDRAEAYMLARGGSIKERTDTSVTFWRYVPPTATEWIIMFFVTLFTFGLGFIFVALRMALMICYPAEARLMARRAKPGKTRVLVDGRHQGYREELELWVGEGLPDP